MGVLCAHSSTRLAERARLECLVLVGAVSLETPLKPSYDRWLPMYIPHYCSRQPDDVPTQTQELRTVRLEGIPKWGFLLFPRDFSSLLSSLFHCSLSLRAPAKNVAGVRIDRSLARGGLAPLHHIRHQHYTRALISSIGNSASSRTLHSFPFLPRLSVPILLL